MSKKNDTFRNRNKIQNELLRKNNFEYFKLFKIY